MAAGIALVNGTVLTLDPARPEVEAVLIEGGTIRLVGGSDEVGESAGAYVPCVDLDGRTVLPGFTDAHVHLLRGGGRRHWIDLSSARSLEDLQRLLKDAPAKPGSWVLGRGFDESTWVDRTFPRMEHLDVARLDRPVLIIRVDGHVGVVNRRAYQKLNLKTDLRGLDVVGGRPSGILKEDALAEARRAVRPTREDLLQELPHMVREAHRHGITSIHDIVRPEDVAAYEEARDAWGLKLRVAVLPTAKDRVVVPPIRENPWLRLGPVKIFADGSFGARTAALTDPYRDDVGNRGMLIHSQDDLERLIGQAHEAGVPTAIHAIGDRGIDRVLDAYEAVGTRPGDRVEHSELPVGDSLDRMRRLGISACMQPNFLGRWGLRGGLYENRLGPHRTGLTNPFRRVLDSGVGLLFGSDGMPLSPLYGIHWAVNGPEPSQRLTVEQAVTAYTSSSWLLDAGQATASRLTHGSPADLVVLSDDPRRAPGAVADLAVDLTLVAGEVVYERPTRRN